MNSEIKLRKTSFYQRDWDLNKEPSRNSEAEEFNEWYEKCNRE